MKRVLVASVLLVACQPSGPRSLSECLLENVTPGVSNAVAQVRKQACESQFPGDMPVLEVVRGPRLEAMSFTGGSSGSGFQLRIDNQSELEIVSATIARWSSGRDYPPQIYREKISVSPYSKGQGFFALPFSDLMDWAVVELEVLHSDSAALLKSRNGTAEMLAITEAAEAKREKRDWWLALSGKAREMARSTHGDSSAISRVRYQIRTHSHLVDSVGLGGFYCYLAEKWEGDGREESARLLKLQERIDECPSEASNPFLITDSTND